MRSRCLSPLAVLFLLVLSPAPGAQETGDGAETFALPGNLPEGWYARIETDHGRILARLLPEQAPQAVAHFAALAQGRLDWVDPVSGETRSGRFYDGNRVHRVEAGSRFEAGDPTGTGRGGPILWIPPDEGLGPVDFNVAGRLGMTRAPGRRVSAYQFFVTATAQPFLSGHHPCFGVVVSGWDVVFEISAVPAYPNGRPVDPVTIEEIRILPQGDPPPLPEPRPHQPRPAKLEALDKPRED
jgi:peptidyl-prolyl cis-trans isomerase A (cyclophilin A)